MNWKTSNAALPLVTCLTVGLMGCGMESPEAPGDGSGEMPAALQAANVEINNDPILLESRIDRTFEPLAVRPRPYDPSQVAESPKDNGVRLTLVGTVRPPVVDGHVVQANDVEIHDKTAVVAYNFAGDTFAGAVQVIDFKRADRPEIVAEILYRAADVNAVTMQGSQLFVGLASNDPVLTTPAMLEELKFTAGRGIEQTGNWLDMPSWAVTDLAMKGNDVVAAVGARNGGVVLVRRTSRLTMTSFSAVGDVRGIGFDGDAVMSAVGGSPSNLKRHSMPSLSVTKSTSVEGYANEGAKGTIEVYSDRCYLGAGNGGFQVRSGSGELLSALRPMLTSNVDPRTVVVNAATVDDDLGFLAAGPQGVLVVQLGRYRCGDHADEDDNDLALLGSLGLEDGASCNMVKTRNDILVVAAGAGGVKLITMSN